MGGLSQAGRFVLLAGLLAALCSGAFSLRRRFVATWFLDGPRGPAPALPQPGAAGSATGPGADHPAPLAPIMAVRVLLLDGLSADAAAALPSLSRLCAGATDLQIDVGFPTVSLPVQAVLWTGLTQQQLGLQYRIKRLDPPLAEAAPARITGSLAVAEDQPFIAASFGFATVLPAAPVPAAWGDSGFAEAATRAVASEAGLAFVHVLRIDKAGHKTGAASAAYAQAASTADQLLDRMLQAAPPAPDRRWFVLSDHGHRARGGHGGAEEHVRQVRGCIAGGPAGPPPVAGGPVHLIDVSRALFDALALPPAPAAVGRPLAFALGHPAPGATLPQDAGRRLALALALSLFLLLGLVRPRALRPRGRLQWGALAWMPLAYLGILLVAGPPTLSNPIIYPPLGRDIVIAGAPGLLLLLALVVRAGQVTLRSRIDISFIALAPVLVAALATLFACGGLGALIDSSRGAPLVEPVTAHASVLLALLAAAALLLALLSLISALLAAVGYLRSKRPVTSLV